MEIRPGLLESYLRKSKSELKQLRQRLHQRDKDIDALNTEYNRLVKQYGSTNHDLERTQRELETHLTHTISQVSPTI